MELEKRNVSISHFRELALQANTDNLEMIYNIMEAAARGGVYSVTLPEGIIVNETQTAILEEEGFYVDENYINDANLTTIAWEE